MKGQEAQGLATKVLKRPAARLLLFASVLGLLVACSSQRSSVGAALNLTTDLHLNISANEEINPDHTQRPSPVVIRLYELKDVSVFEKADFIDIYERDQDLLSTSLVARHLLKPVIPGEERQERLVLKPDTTHVGLFAEFAQYQGASYKVVFPVTQHNVFRDLIRVTLSGTEVSLSR